MRETVVAQQRQEIEAILARSAFYRGLSMLLRHPDADAAQWLALEEHHRLPEIIKWLTKGESGPLQEAVGRLVDEMDATSVPKWTHRYEEIFGHSVHGAAPPYELEYGQEHEQRQPQELGDITAFYQAFGLRVCSSAHERADHIVTECEFLQFLLYKQACALDEGKEEQARLCESAARQFLADHLGHWGPAFCLRLARAANPGVLGAVADVALAWLAEECARMKVSVGSADLPLRLPKEKEGVDCGSCSTLAL